MTDKRINISTISQKAADSVLSQGLGIANDQWSIILPSSLAKAAT